MDLTRQEFVDTFAKNLEIERIRLDISQEQMAKELDMSLSAYKRIINGETQKVDIYVTYLGYILTQKMLFEMVEYSDANTEIMRKIRHLNDSQIKALDHLIDTFMEK